jgi:Flp pilus assembly protein TadG
MSRFRDDRGGSVIILFAAALIPILLVTFGALQYSMAVGARAKLNAIADAAALQAVSTPAMLAYTTNGTVGQSQAQTMFNTQAATLNGVTVNTLSVNVVGTPATATTTAKLTATVTYQATVTSVVPGILGTYFTTINGTAVASSQVPAYVNFFLLLDDSPSMGIGASASDITKMQNANNGCAFACHSPNATQANYPGYTLPNVPGTQLRIDAMRSAVNTLITTAINSKTVANQFKIGLYTFDNDVSVISPLTTNLAQVQTDNNNIQLPTSDLGTQFGDSVDWLSKNVVTTSGGSGTQASPFQFVFIVTDGVEDHAFNFTSGGSYHTLINPIGYWYGSPYSSVVQSSACTSLKNKGVTVAVLYTNYHTMSDMRYTSLVQPFASNILGALQACASPNFFFQADNASDITNAMQQMFSAALAKTAHLSQ